MRTLANMSRAILSAAVFAFAGWALLSILPSAQATTLEQLTLEQMARLSTAIVRAKIGSARADVRGGDVYTTHTLKVLETWKRDVSGRAKAVAEVSTPGGVAEGLRQVVEGAPDLREGDEYVIFLWTSRSGLTQVIGLSQGLFRVQADPSGKTLLATRTSAAERILDASGRPAVNQAFSMKLWDFKARVLGEISRNSGTPNQQIAAKVK